MPHRRDILEVLFVWLQTNGEKLFWLTIGGVVQVYMTSRQKEHLTKLNAFGIWITSLFVGWWVEKLAAIMNAGEYSFLIGAAAATFSISILSAVNDNIAPMISKLLNKFIK